MSNRFSRNGVQLGAPTPAAQAAQAVPTRLPISALIPLEGAVLRATLDDYRTQIQRGVTLPPVRVVDVAGEWLVVDGNHRVLAALLEGSPDVAINVVASGMNATFHAASVRWALRRNRKGFQGLTVVSSVSDRETFTKREQKEDEGADWLNELNKQP